MWPLISEKHSGATPLHCPSKRRDKFRFELRLQRGDVSLCGFNTLRLERRSGNSTTHGIAPTNAKADARLRSHDYRKYVRK
jgi:hypothetical protein